MQTFIRLFLISLLAVVLTIVIYLLDRKTKFGKIKYIWKQVIIGVIFGGAAIFGTEVGVNVNGAMLNARDAAPLAAGFFFGGPAGIIAGLIGGIERAFAHLWGRGVYTTVACSVTTSLAGFYAAFLRKAVFENKRPSPIFCAVFAVVIEVFHMAMVYFTHPNDVVKVLSVLNSAAIPMVLVNSISVFISALALMFLHHFSYKTPLIDKKKKPKISSVVQNSLLVVIVVSFIATNFITRSIQQQLSDKSLMTSMTYSIDEVKNEINTDSNEVTIEPAPRIVIGRMANKTLQKIKEENRVSEIHIVNTRFQIVESTIPEVVHYDLSSNIYFQPFIQAQRDSTTYVGSVALSPFDESETLIRYAYVPEELTAGYYILFGTSTELINEKIEEQYLKNYTFPSLFSASNTLSIVNTKNEVVASSIPEDKLTPQKIEDIIAACNHNLNSLFNYNLDGVKQVASLSAVSGFTIISSADYDESYVSRDIAIHMNAYCIILLSGILYIMIYLLIKYIVVLKIKKVNESLGAITSGDLNEVVTVSGNREFETLSTDINSTVTTLKKYISEAEARIDQELEFARTIQLSSLPTNYPNNKQFEIYARSIPAKEVGGDFYDFYYTAEGKLNVMIADVSGKGIPAAMFMMHAKTELKALGEADTLPGEAFTKGNEALCEGNDALMFVTAWQATIDLRNGKCLFANAGHNPPVIKKKNGKFEFLENKKSMVLAALEGAHYKDQELQLEPGDILVLYTDGVTEAQNSNQELYGNDRLLENLNKCEDLTAKGIYTQMKQTVLEFQGDAPQFDDITVLILKYKENKA